MKRTTADPSLRKKRSTQDDKAGPWADIDAVKAEMEAAKATARTPTLQEAESDEQSGDERIIKRIVSKPVKTLEDLGRECKIDLSVWEITRWKCAAWQTAMKPFRPRKEEGKGQKANGKNGTIRFEPIYSQQFVVQAWMRPRHAIIAAKNEVEALRKKAANYAPTYSAANPKSPLDKLRAPSLSRGKIQNPKSADLLAEYSIFDYHFGVLIWGRETDGPNSDLKIQKAGYEAAGLDLIAKAKHYGAERALVVLGNDQQNFDNRAGTTTKGTPQDTDGRYQKVFEVSRDCSIWLVECLMEAHRFVDVVMCPGNHDQLSTWHLGDSLASWFHKCDRVKVDNRPVFRKYFEFGVNMLMFTHGHLGKLEGYPNLMSVEQPEMWGRTLWREAHTGDKHHRRLLELRGAAVRILPSLRPPDAWTAENQFIGSLRAAEAFVWDRKAGMQANLVHSVL